MDKPQNPSATRDAIIGCAVEIIDEAGESALRVMEITERTGVSVSSIYYFFGSRDGLIVAAQIERFARGFLANDERFGSSFLGARTKEEFRQAVIELHEILCDPRAAPTRMVRVNVVGSTLGRPQLREEIAKIQDQLLGLMISSIRPAYERGWIRRDVDLAALAAWTISQLFGRVLIELGETSAPPQEWNRLAVEAALCLYFGEMPTLRGPEDHLSAEDLSTR
jgi:AcrR family transcriptional regulator